VLGGGCINHATLLETGKERYFLKWNSDPLPEVFHTEALGLRLLAETITVRVPGVLAYAEKDGSSPAFLLLEWLEGPEKDDQAALGQQLAALHQAPQPGGTTTYFGLDHHNYIGSTRQYNQPDPNWATFYIEQRILPQARLCQENGHMSLDRRLRIDRLAARLPGLLNGRQVRPSLIHGDLWAGNVIHGPTGLALVDPAVSYSDREAEIAYTELFGGFSSRFYASYQESWPLDAGYPERRDLYNLYHLLNHLNIFDESYGSHVDSILRRYT
jgi:fructosamine-3-kinase